MKIKFFENAKRRKYVLQINKEFTFEEKSAVEDKIFVLDNEINSYCSKINSLENEIKTKNDVDKMNKLSIKVDVYAKMLRDSVNQRSILTGDSIIDFKILAPKKLRAIKRLRKRYSSELVNLKCTLIDATGWCMNDLNDIICLNEELEVINRIRLDENNNWRPVLNDYESRKIANKFINVNSYLLDGIKEHLNSLKELNAMEYELYNKEQELLATRKEAVLDVVKEVKRK